MSDNEKEQGFKIVDKRRFTSDGEARSDVPEDMSKDDPIHNSDNVVNFKKVEKAADEDMQLPEINFTSFVLSLATQAMIQLGEMGAPEGYQIPEDRMAAKQSIDILSMLEAKTKGNLSSDEEKMLEDVLYQLRMSYVKGR